MRQMVIDDQQDQELSEMSNKDATMEEEYHEYNIR